MIIGKLSESQAYHFLLANPLWKAAFQELEKLSEETPLGDYALPDFPEAIVKVMRYDTKELVDCRFETHRKHVDLQYTIAGAEMILWRDREELKEDGEFDEEKDLQFYHPDDSKTAVHKTKGCFSIYYPADAHRPQLGDGQFTSVFKAVIKLPVDQV